LCLRKSSFGTPERLKTDSVQHSRRVVLVFSIAVSSSLVLLCHRVSPPLCECIVCVVFMSSSSVNLVDAGECQRPVKDTLGHWLCVLCPTPTRITHERRSSRTWGSGRAHHKCIKQHERRGTKRPASEALPELLRERPPPPQSSSTPAAAPTVCATASEPKPAAASQSCLQRFCESGHAIVPSSELSRTLAWRVMQLSHRSPSGSTIAGEVKQVDLNQLKNTGTLEEEWAVLAKSTAALCGIDAEPMFVVNTKILSAPPGRGHQPVHFDCARGKAARGKYSCILICSNGCYSTALPRFAENEDLSFSDEPQSMQKVAHLLETSHYESVPVSAGDIIFFRQSTPHHGVQNTMPQGNRVVLFSILSSSDAPGQDEKQVFPWLYVGYAFGWESKEFALALVAGRKHKPVTLISLDFGEEDRDSAQACLRSWDLLEAYSKP
jgi:hypothetical protein